ncbi:MAG: 2Fe-2S iron-sulfur cluster-binding protein [Ktedonobacterales bacterium]
MGPPSPTPASLGWVAAQVVGRAFAARDAVTLWFAAPGTQRAPTAYRPGQFITLALPTARGLVYRSYSLCGEGRTDAPWEITIKRQEGGVASNYLYANAQPGMIFQASPPLGAFTLPARMIPNSTLIFVATGSGITPIMGMLRALARVAPALHLHVQLHYAYHSASETIYGQALAALDPQRVWLSQWHYQSSRGTRLTPERVITAAGSAMRSAEWYVCGSEQLKRSLEAHLQRAGVPSAQFHSESFGDMRRQSMASIPLSSFSGPAPRIRLAETGAVLTARPQETLLETLERSGYRPPFNCRTGACGTCQMRLLAGQVQRGAESGLTPAQQAAGAVLSCVARPVGDVTIFGAGRQVATPVAAVAGRIHANSAVYRPARTAMRLALSAGAIALFIGAWTLTNYKPIHTASAAPVTAPSSGLPGDDDQPTATPSGSGGITISPSQNIPPSTGSGVS